MRARHPFPRIWLMTDPRFGDGLLTAIRCLPFGSGVIFRHYELPGRERRALFRKIRRICRQRGHLLVLAGNDRQAVRWNADGFHQRSSGRSALLHTAPVHDLRELATAKRHRADIVLISPLFATNSHPKQRPLGKFRFNSLAALARPANVIALGGVTYRNASGLNPHVVYGWAAVDAFRTRRLD